MSSLKLPLYTALCLIGALTLSACPAENADPGEGECAEITACSPMNKRQILLGNTCGELLGVAQLCVGKESCHDVDPETGMSVEPRCALGENGCMPQHTRSCDRDDPTKVFSTNSCTQEVVVAQQCQGEERCVVEGGEAVCAVEACVPKITVVCDDSDEDGVFSHDSCTGALTKIETCTEVGQACVPGKRVAGKTQDAMCDDVCGKDVTFVCDPAEPDKVFTQNDCGERTGVFKTCDAPSVCELNSIGSARCSCLPLEETSCNNSSSGLGFYGGTSEVRRKNTCGSDDIIDSCAYGARCFQDEDYNGGVAECTRSIDESQASSPHYDYGCFSKSELVMHKTSLEMDCRCRTIGDGGSGQGAGYAQPSTMMNPGKALPNCRPVSEVKNLTWDTPAGSGPQFSVFSSSSVNDKWYGSWLDAPARDLYTVVSWTSSEHRVSGTVVRYNLDTGARKVISGLYFDPQQGKTAYGSGYESPNSVSAGPATQPLTGVSAMQGGPDGMLYTLGIGTTGELVSRAVEIVRINPATGERTLVWQSQADERGVNVAPNGWGQCLSHIHGNTGGVDSYESVPLGARGFGIGPQGHFYMTFKGTYEGDGIIEVTPDGSSCRFVTRWGAREWRLTPQTPLKPRPASIGGGHAPQTSRMYAMMWRSGSLYVATERLELLKVDVATGERSIVSGKDSGYAGLGRTSIFYDESRDLIFTAGGPSARDGAVIDEVTGRREELFADTSIPGRPLLESVYGIRRSVTSPPTTLAQGNTLNFGPMVMDPQDPDILWFVIKGGALLKFELSTFNNYIFSL